MHAVAGRWHLSSPAAGRSECRWQRSQVPPHLLSLVLEDQARRNDICWGLFAD